MKSQVLHCHNRCGLQKLKLHKAAFARNQASLSQRVPSSKCMSRLACLSRNNNALVQKAAVFSVLAALPCPPILQGSSPPLPTPGSPETRRAQRYCLESRFGEAQQGTEEEFRAVGYKVIGACARQRRPRLVPKQLHAPEEGLGEFEVVPHRGRQNGGGRLR